MDRLILIILGVLAILFSYPKFRMPIIARLFNEGFVTPKLIRPEDAEIVKFTGPNFSLLFIGTGLILLGIIISIYQ